MVFSYLGYTHTYFSPNTNTYTNTYTYTIIHTHKHTLFPKHKHTLFPNSHTHPYTQRGARMRSRAKTGMNGSSSRSHAIYTLHLGPGNTVLSTGGNGGGDGEAQVWCARG